MKLSTTTVASLTTLAVAVNAAPAATNDAQLAIRELNLDSALAELNELKAKREGYESEISKREYKIVTDVLTAIKNTNLAPEILQYFGEAKSLQPVVVSVVVGLLKSDLINYTTVFQILDKSNLIGTVITQLISDCSLYVDLFNIAKSYISDLIPIVQSKLSDGLSSLGLRDNLYQVRETEELEKRDVQDIVVNLMESLGNSGLAAQVVKTILTDPGYIPFAVELVTGIIAADALPVSEIVDAIKNTSLVSDLLKQILTFQTFDTVVTNAFAAFAGTCAADSGYTGSTGSSSSGSLSGLFGGLLDDLFGSSGSTSTGSTGSGSGSSGSSGNSGSSSGGTTVITNPCKRRRRSYY
jgi:uncharacterized protein (UPF0297 family)